jgi:hypothetical protein
MPGHAGGGKGPQFEGSGERGQAEETGVSLQAPIKLQKLQQALHVKAKETPEFRFYAL